MLIRIEVSLLLVVALLHLLYIWVDKVLRRCVVVAQIRLFKRVSFHQGIHFNLLKLWNWCLTGLLLIILYIILSCAWIYILLSKLDVLMVWQFLALLALHLYIPPHVWIDTLLNLVEDLEEDIKVGVRILLRLLFLLLLAILDHLVDDLTVYLGYFRQAFDQF